jgi:hypothetical protein
MQGMKLDKAKVARRQLGSRLLVPATRLPEMAHQFAGRTGRQLRES